MRILFLTLVKINSLNERGIYTDLLRKFNEEGDLVTVVCPTERREKKPTILIREGLSTILKVKTLNLQKTNIIEKGIGTLAVEYQFLNAIKKYLLTSKFDIVLYSTPPITFSKVILFIKKRDNAYAYLLLKDIFPQNAVDMQMIKANGLLHNFFLNKEKKLYAISDTIGCMSPANKDYIIKHNPEVDVSKIEVNPNTISPIEFNQSLTEKDKTKRKYGLPLNKKIFVYGGNLGVPQGIDFLLETIVATQKEKAFFLIVGSGTVYSKIEKWFLEKQPKNAKLLFELPKLDYIKLLTACDVGLIFLNKNFTIPNFPSRLLSYLEMRMPVIASTDPVSDLGRILEQYECGEWVLSGDIEHMKKAISTFVYLDAINFAKKKNNAYKLLEKEYLISYSYDLIKNKI